jgi:Divergent InlB B-repeat domain
MKVTRALQIIFAMIIAITLAACGGGGGGGGSPTSGGGSNTTRQLNVAVTGGGVVTSQPSGINCGSTCNASFATNASVTLTAAAASGQMFSSWGGVCAGTTAPTCTVRMDAVKSVTATFSANTGTSFPVSVTVSGNGTVTSQPAGINCGTSCNGDYAQGTSITLTATPAAGNVFSAWSGACSGGTVTCVLSMTEARTATATFVPQSTGAVTPTYEALTLTTSAATLLDQLNLQGARGLRSMGDRGFGTSFGQTDEFASLYVKEANTTYTYEILALPATAPVMLTQLNDQGARGYAFYGALAFSIGLPNSGALYIKENGSSATFAYELPDAANSEAAFLTQANSQGDNGFFSVSPYIFTSDVTETKHIYVKDNSSSAKFTYVTQPYFDPSTPEQFIAQADEQGQLGYKFNGAFAFIGGFKHIYVKDTSQSSTFQWKAEPPSSTSAAFVVQANSVAAQGYADFAPNIFFPNGSSQSLSAIARELYFKSVNCAGHLCSVASPF